MHPSQNVTPIYQQRKAWKTDLYSACEQGNTQEVKRLLKECENSNNRFEDQTPFDIACNHSHLGLIQYLLETVEGVLRCSSLMTIRKAKPGEADYAKALLVIMKLFLTRGVNLGGLLNQKIICEMVPPQATEAESLFIALIDAGMDVLSNKDVFKEVIKTFWKVKGVSDVDDATERLVARLIARQYEKLEQLRVLLDDRTLASHQAAAFLRVLPQILRDFKENLAPVSIPCNVSDLDQTYTQKLAQKYQVSEYLIETTWLKRNQFTRFEQTRFEKNRQDCKNPPILGASGP